MIVSINQPCYLPWAGLIARIDASDIHVHLDDVQYSKNTFFNRNRIIDRAGSEVMLTVPVRASSTDTFCEAKIADDKWRAKHIRSLEQAYSKNESARPLLRQLCDLLNKPFASLADLNVATTDWIVETLRIRTKILRASALDVSGVASERVLAICEKLAATQYHSPAGARAYFDETMFVENGIKVEFQNYAPVEYEQGRHAFVARLSVVDALFRLGPVDTLSVIRAGVVRTELA